MHRKTFMALFLFLLATLSLILQDQAANRRLKRSYQRPQVSGWTFVHLEGTPSEIGYQHGYQLAPSILDISKLVALELKHGSGYELRLFA